MHVVGRAAELCRLEVANSDKSISGERIIIDALIKWFVEQ